MAFTISSDLLDYCVLSLIKDKDRYGYSFTQKMQEVMDISESTIYPVLRRLKKNKFLDTYNKEYQGRNRKYYSITKEGLEQIKNYQDDWEEFKKIIETLTGKKEGEKDHD